MTQRDNCISQTGMPSIYNFILTHSLTHFYHNNSSIAAVNMIELFSTMLNMISELHIELFV